MEVPRMASSQVANIKIQPVNVTWEIEDQVCIETIADTSDSLDGKYFTLMGTHYIWLDGVAAVDPAPVGLTAVPVAYASNDSANVIAGLIQVALDALGDFSATVADNVVIVTSADVLTKSDSADVDTGFTLTRQQEGGSLDMGLLEGDVEDTFEEQLLDITAHQTGTTVLTALRQGVSAEISLTMQETNIARLKEIFGSTGGEAFTPGAGTEVFGWGTSRQGTNVIIQSRRLRLHPVGAADNAEDLTFWKAYPKPDSLVYSGENPKTLSLTFSIFRDEVKDARISYFVFGDATQTGL